MFYAQLGAGKNKKRNKQNSDGIVLTELFLLKHL